MNISPISRQHGAVLIISLVILITLTGVGVSVMNNSLVEEKIANNQRDMDTALQAAEVAMKAAEDRILDTANPLTWDSFDPTVNPGLYPEQAPGSDEIWRLKATWNGSGSVVVNPSVQAQGYYENPRYIIERIGEIEEGPSMTERRMIKMLRITAKGSGTSEKSSVFLQGHYRWEN
ncbi:MAG: hypothetical protein HUJ30_03895 [Gammaproteobacteria bacterium]|nr:hypothetical protein [Gammaproteobacteria bacterium]